MAQWYEVQYVLCLLWRRKSIEYSQYIYNKYSRLSPLTWIHQRMCVQPTQFLRNFNLLVANSILDVIQTTNIESVILTLTCSNLCFTKFLWYIATDCTLFSAKSKAPMHFVQFRTYFERNKIFYLICAEQKYVSLSLTLNYNSAPRELFIYFKLKLL